MRGLRFEPNDTRRPGKCHHTGTQLRKIFRTVPAECVAPDIQGN